MQPTFVIVGGSAGKGAGSLRESWPERLRLAVEEAPHGVVPRDIGIVYNLCIFNQTSEEMFEAISEIGRRFNRPNDTHRSLIIHVPGNDTLRNIETGEHAVEPEETADNIRLLIQEAKLHRAEVTVMGILPVNEEKTRGRRSAKLNGDIELYNRLLKEVCEQEGATFIDCYRLFTDYGGYGELLCEDGVHPNDRGHELIYIHLKVRAEHQLGALLP